MIIFSFFHWEKWRLSYAVICLWWHWRWQIGLFHPYNQLQPTERRCPEHRVKQASDSFPSVEGIGPSASSQSRKGSGVWMPALTLCHPPLYRQSERLPSESKAPWDPGAYRISCHHSLYISHLPSHLHWHVYHQSHCLEVTNKDVGSVSKHRPWRIFFHLVPLSSSYRFIVTLEGESQETGSLGVRRGKKGLGWAIILRSEGAWQRRRHEISASASKGWWATPDGGPSSSHCVQEVETLPEPGTAPHPA